MPLPDSKARREVHHRLIDMRTYARDDGQYEAEAHLVDTKPFDFKRPSSPDPIPAGRALHDLWVRITVDDQLVVKAIGAASDVTPWGICKEAEATLSVMIGERLVRGWSSTVKARLHGAASCTHLMEMLIPLATTALQGIRGLSPEAHPGDTAAARAQIDSCYAFGREREVVKLLWPMQYQAMSKPHD